MNKKEYKQFNEAMNEAYETMQEEMRIITQEFETKLAEAQKEIATLKQSKLDLLEELDNILGKYGNE